MSDKTFRKSPDKDSHRQLLKSLYSIYSSVKSHQWFGRTVFTNQHLAPHFQLAWKLLGYKTVLRNCPTVATSTPC
ncbi:hypothetical protein QQG55_44410 [Brugia pahangi]